MLFYSNHLEMVPTELCGITLLLYTKEVHCFLEFYIILPCWNGNELLVSSCLELVVFHGEGAAVWLRKGHLVRMAWVWV